MEKTQEQTWQTVEGCQMTLKISMLRHLNNSRTGMTAWAVWKSLDFDVGTQTIRSMLSQAVKRGYIRIDGAIECDCCGECHILYRIADGGRIFLNERAA